MHSKEGGPREVERKCRNQKAAGHRWGGPSGPYIRFPSDLGSVLEVAGGAGGSSVGSEARPLRYPHQPRTMGYPGTLRALDSKQMGHGAHVPRARKAICLLPQCPHLKPRL